MSSKSKENVEIQKSLHEAAFHRRQAELKNQNLDDGKISKDPQLRHLRAKVRQANKRLFAISKIEKKTEALASRKKEKATEKPKELKPSKKSAPKPPIKKPKGDEATPAD
jgi:hypothetical protein